MTNDAQLTCPTCDRRFAANGFRFGPFCSERCQRVDLGRWLRESYAVPSTPSLDDELDEIPPGFERNRTSDYDYS
ncbi:MAG: DNA gyrase inhibitor YacG [Pirellulales bacterium]